MHREFLYTILYEKFLFAQILLNIGIDFHFIYQYVYKFIFRMPILLKSIGNECISINILSLV